MSDLGHQIPLSILERITNLPFYCVITLQGFVTLGELLTRILWYNAKGKAFMDLKTKIVKMYFVTQTKCIILSFKFSILKL